MPAIECENGKWKWGENGSCVYNSEEEAQNDNENYRDMNEQRDMTSLNQKGYDNAEALIKAGKYNTDSDWDFTAADGNQLLGDDDWNEYSKWFLAFDDEAEEETKGRYGYPFGKNGEVYRKALIATRQYAGRFKLDSIFQAAGRLIDMIDENESRTEKNIKIVLGSPCSGKSTYVRNNMKDGDIIWDFDLIHQALCNKSSHDHIKEIREYVFVLREAFYNKLKEDKNTTAWIINSSPYKKVRNELREMFDAQLIYLKINKTEALERANKERPSDWINYINNFFERFEDIDENENIKVINNETEEEKRHIISVKEDEKTITIVYEKDMHDNYDETEEEEIIEDVIDENNIKIWDKKFNNIAMEKRVYNIENRVEKRDDGKEVVVGHASIYDSRSENLGGFYEYIAKGAFTEELIKKSDVRALINHDPNLILARNTSGTLKLEADEKGLRYEFAIPDTSYGRDLAINLKNGNINQSSFAFIVAENGDEWTTDDNGNDIRTINTIERLYDISSVTYPAYAAAESDLVVAQRGLSMYKEKKEKIREENDLVARSLAQLKIELIKRKK